MGRVFRRGELKEAIVAVLARVGQMHGYGIMTELKERVGGGWKPSPGAIYPALIALEDSGLVRVADRDGTKVYRLSDAGRRAAERSSAWSRWASLTERAEQGEERLALGPLLDRFAAESTHRRRLVGPDAREALDQILSRMSDEIEGLLMEGDDDG
ncbi:MAG: PadR family transcriptional regulator [Acidimicrobiia bacterium]